MILFQIWFSSISLFLLVSFSIPSHVLAVHLAVKHWKDGIKHVTCKKLNKVHLELSVKAPPVGGLVWSFVVTFDVWLLREFLLDCGLHSGQSDNFRQSPTHFLLFLYTDFFFWSIWYFPITSICRYKCVEFPQIGGDAFITDQDLLPLPVSPPLSRLQLIAR